MPENVIIAIIGALGAIAGALITAYSKLVEANKPTRGVIVIGTILGLGFGLIVGMVYAQNRSNTPQSSASSTPSPSPSPTSEMPTPIVVEMQPPGVISNYPFPDYWPRLGLASRDITGEFAQALKLPTSYGVMVGAVMPGSVSDKAGLRGATESVELENGDQHPVGGDIIIAINGKKIRNMQDLTVVIYSEAVTSGVATIVYLRDGNEHQTQIVLPKLRQIYGPISGALQHDDNDDSAPLHRAGVDLQEFVVEAEFCNPYDASEGRWNYGFNLWATTTINSTYRLVVDSEKSVALLVFDDEKRSHETINSLTLRQIKVLENDCNLVRLFVLPGTIFIFINNTYVDSWSIKDFDETNSGDVAVGTGFYREDEMEGMETVFNDFVILSVE